MPSSGGLRKRTRRRKPMLLHAFPYSHWQSSFILLLKHCFVSIRTYFFGIPVHTQDHLRHLSLATEELLISWPFYWESAIFALARPHPVSHSNTPSGCICVYVIHLKGEPTTDALLGQHNSCFLKLLLMSTVSVALTCHQRIFYLQHTVTTTGQG